MYLLEEARNLGGNALKCVAFAHVEDSWFVVWGAEFRIEGLGCRIQGSGFGVYGVGCRVQGVGPTARKPLNPFSRGGAQPWRKCPRMCRRRPRAAR